MPTRNVVLTDRQEAFINELLESGRYQNASEVLREGLRLLEDRADRQAAVIAQIRAGVLEGMAQAEAGELAEGSGGDAIERALDRARKLREA